MEVRIEPGGGAVVYVDSGANAAGEMESNLWMVAAEGRARRQITQGAWRDWSPLWAFDPREGDEQFATGPCGR